MAYLKSHKELIVWQRAMQLVKEIFLLTGKFPHSELYGITSQMRRSAVSIPSNIAEGYGRKSTKSYIQFYAIAYGSTLELDTQLIIAKDLKMTDANNFNVAESLLIEVSKMLNAIISKMKNLSPEA